jgi:hypothetical protein
MAESIGYRVTRAGDITVYRIIADGLMRVIWDEPSGPPPVPPWLIPVLRIRGMIADPLANDLLYVLSLPPAPPAGTAFTIGDGGYRVYRDGVWVPLALRFTDGVIEDVFNQGGTVLSAAALLIDRLIARIDPQDYITSGTAGGQSLGFPSLADMLAFYRGLKKDLLDEAARLNGTDTGRFFVIPKPPVGGVYEEGGPWA